MRTDQLCSRLQKNALKVEEDKIVLAMNAYMGSLRVSGTSKRFAFNDVNGHLFYIDTNSLFHQINNQMIDDMTETVKAKAVTDFMEKFAQFKDYMENMGD